MVERHRVLICHLSISYVREMGFMHLGRGLCLRPHRGGVHRYQTRKTLAPCPHFQQAKQGPEWDASCPVTLNVVHESLLCPRAFWVGR
jgi:hypothetical protein